MAVEQADNLTNRNARPSPLDRAEELITLAHAAAVRGLLDANHISAHEISVIGFHGQTVIHKPEAKLTVQLGDGRRLAKLLGVDVVSDFRAADVAEGGQGAPLVPIFHKALADAADLPRPLCILNIGGVANVTWIGVDGELIAFDTGPGNALIDDWMRRHAGEDYDDNGQLARRGVADSKALETLLADPYFRKTPPKSLDRHSFATRGESTWLRMKSGAKISTRFEPPEAVRRLSPADGAATLTAFTAGAAMLAKKHFPQQPALWVVAGGGARNGALTGALRSLLRVPVKLADEVGWSGKHLEAQAFAFLAVRSLRGLPLTFPKTTGVGKPLTGGVRSRAETETVC
jgi:anhydro-N-acetylmuramic acid kinase